MTVSTPSKLSLYLQLIRWNRPAGWLLLLWPTLSALWVASNGFPGWHLLAVFTLGTFLMRSAGCCINDVADRDFDRHVKRTAQRPVTSGALVRERGAGSRRGAGAAGLRPGADHQSNHHCLVIWRAGHHAGLSVCQALCVHAAGRFGRGFQCWHFDGVCRRPVAGAFAGLGLLLLGNLFWVIAYDTEYAMVDRDDDLKIGMKTSAITLGRFDVAAIMLFYLAFLSIWALALMGRVPSAILLVALFLALPQALWHGWLIRKRERDDCFKAFRLNHWLGFTVFAGIALAYRMA